MDLYENHERVQKAYREIFGFGFSLKNSSKTNCDLKVLLKLTRMTNCT